MSEKISSRPHYSVPFGKVENGVVTISDEWQSYFDDLDFSVDLFLGDSLIPPFFLSTEAPDVAANEGGVIYFSDLKVRAFSNGTNWLNQTTGVIIV